MAAEAAAQAEVAPAAEAEAAADAEAAAAHGARYQMSKSCRHLRTLLQSCVARGAQAPDNSLCSVAMPAVMRALASMANDAVPAPVPLLPGCWTT